MFFPLNLLFSLKLSLGTGSVRIPPKLLNCKHAAKVNWRVQFGHVNVITVFIYTLYTASEVALMW